VAAGDEGAAHPWVTAVGYRRFTSALRFEGDLDRELTAETASTSLGRMLGDTWMLRASIARVMAGHIRGAGKGTATIVQGWMFGASLSRRFTIDDLPNLYIGGSASFAMQFSRAGYGGTDGTSALTAADLRLGATVGWMILERFVPYATARVFGGPVFWRALADGGDLSGTDRYHFQVGGGLTAIIVSGLYITAEHVPLGEKSSSIELGVRF